MNLSDAQSYLSDSNAGKVTWDDTMRSQAQDVISGVTPKVSTIKMADLGPTATDFATNLNTMENAAFDEYKGAVSSQAKPLQVFRQFSEELGIPKLKQSQATLTGTISDLEDTLDRVEGNVNATTRESYVTEGQRQGLVTAGQEPIMRNLSKISTAAGRIGNQINEAQSLLGTMTQLAMQGQDRDLAPYQQKLQMVSNQAARLMTGYTSDRETQLTLLMDKLQRERQLDDREWALANQLASEERTFSRAKEQFLFENANQSPSTQIVTINGSQRLIDTNTGQTIMELGRSSAPASGGSVITPGSNLSENAKQFMPNKNTSQSKPYTPPASMMNQPSYSSIDWGQFGL